MVAKRLQVLVERLPHGEGLPLPSYHSDGAAGLDLVAALPKDARIILKPGGRHLIPTGIRLEIPPGFEGQVRPRSGHALNFGVTVLNAPGTIDSDYRGEIKVLLINLGDEAFEITRGARIAQLVVAPFVRVAMAEADQLAASARQENGFGSTGHAAGCGECL